MRGALLPVFIDPTEDQPRSFSCAKRGPTGSEEVGVRMPSKASQRRKTIATVNAVLRPALPMPAPRAGPRFVH